MGWKKYQETLTVKHEFSQFGCDEFWVKLRRLDSMPYGETREAGGMTPEELAEVQADPARAEEARDKMESDLIDVIADWYITDPTIQGDDAVSDEQKKAPMPLPTSEDKTSLMKLPTEFIVVMIEWIEADSNIAKRVSKRTGTSSGRP